jgi:hypothetical protein
VLEMLAQRGSCFGQTTSGRAVWLQTAAATLLAIAGLGLLHSRL